jgi:hypothetical protein
MKNFEFPAYKFLVCFQNIINYKRHFVSSGMSRIKSQIKAF